MKKDVVMFVRSVLSTKVANHFVVWLMHLTCGIEIEVHFVMMDSTSNIFRARGGMADAVDSKSAGRTAVGVRIPPGPPILDETIKCKEWGWNETIN